MKNNKKENIFNQHSALTTFRITDGKYYKIGVEKSIFALLLRAQYELKDEFKKLFLSTLNKLGISKDNHEKVLKITFTNKSDYSLNTKVLNQHYLKTIAKKIIDFKISEVKRMTKDENIIRIKSTTIKAMTLNGDLNIDKIDEAKLNEIILEIKNYCKDKAVKSYLDFKSIDFTVLANSINTNSTYLKKDLLKASKTVLEFNYINKKNIEVEIVTSILASVRFDVNKKEKKTWFTYQIPREILELLLIPKVYVPLEGVVVDKLNGIYTLRMYSLLKDHLKRGMIELTKEEIFEFFSLPKSYMNKTNLLKKFLIPTLEEVEKVSGIVTEYEFVPKNRYKKIVFRHKLEKKVTPESLTIIEKNEKINDLKDINKIINKIEKAKKNIYVSKAWNKRVENKINRIIKEFGEEYAVFILDALYKNLKKEIQTTLVQYINGIIKNNPKNEVIESKDIKNIKNIKINKQIINKVEKIKSESDTVIDRETKNKKINKEKPEELSEMAENFVWSMFEKLKEEEQKKYKEKALKEFLKEFKRTKLDKLHTKIYEHSEKKLIIKIMAEDIK